MEATFVVEPEGGDRCAADDEDARFEGAASGADARRFFETLVGVIVCSIHTTIHRYSPQQWGEVVEEERGG